MTPIEFFLYLTYNIFASLFIKNISAVFFINDEVKELILSLLMKVFHSLIKKRE